MPRGIPNKKPTPVLDPLFANADVVLGFKRLTPEAQTPRYQSEGAACFDLHAVNQAVVCPHGATTFSTGLAFDIPAGFVLKVYSRSGHGFKNGVRLANVVGVVDSDYTGELMVRLHNDSPEAFFVFPGDRIAQAMLERMPTVQLVEIDVLKETARGAKGFGSTGK